MRIRPHVLLPLLLLAATPLAGQTTFPDDAAIRALLEQRVQEGRSTGIVVGLVEADGATRFLAAGDAGVGRMPLDAGSVFEIGSITKVFTGILLADMARRGEVSVDDPVADYLPAGVTMPSRNGIPITLAMLSTQTSGLPRLPANLRPSNMLDPYADYTPAMLYEFLSGYTLTRDPGAQYEYSNLGVGLLGHVLALRAGVSYEALVKERILGPLGMEHSGITLTPWMREHATAGHNASGEEVPYWALPTLAGAGALRSNAEDMARFLEANLRGTGPLAESMRDATRPRAQAGSPEMHIGFGWHRRRTDGDTIVWHNGGTGGFRTFAGFDRASGTGVVVLTNTGGEGADDIGFHLLNPDLPLARPARQAIELPPEVLARYPGEYQLSPSFNIVISREGTALWAQPTGQPRVRLWPASETEFFIREVDAQVTFELAGGVVTGLVLHQNGRDMPGRRVSGRDDS